MPVSVIYFWCFLVWFVRFMQLSNEDNLRLNVLLAQKLKAVRIDESKMELYGLTQKGEATITLNPTCKDEKYLKIVRELLSSKVTGSPGGYPVYIKRWTRMGQERAEESLQQLLLLGEPEAVVAVVHAPSLTAEIATHAWWAYPTADNARKLLEKKEVVESPLAKELSAYLLEFLPFEVEHRDMIESARLCLQPGLLSEQEVNDLWKRAKRRQSLYVGFLHTLPDDLPDLVPAHHQFDDIQQKLTPCLADNPYARLLLRLLSSQGQTYLKTTQKVIEKASSQDTVVSLFMALNRYHHKSSLSDYIQLCVEDAEHAAQQYMQNSDNVKVFECAELLGDERLKLMSLLVCSQMGERTLNHVFGHSDALGSVMRKKLKPVTDPLNKHIFNLLS